MLLGESTVFGVRAARGALTAQERAQAASTALKRAVESEVSAEVRIVTKDGVATLSIGETPIIELAPIDAELAGDSSLEVHAAGIAARLRQATEAERRRAAIARTVFSLSLAVFFGLIAFYLLRLLGELADKARSWLDHKPDRELSLRVRRIEVLRPATSRSAAVLGVSVAKWLAQLAVAYAWLVVALSMFEATRDYTQRLTGFVLEPLTTLMQRLASALPLMLVAGIAALAVYMLLRFADLFFKSVGRGETPLPWLPAELAASTSILVRVALVLGALVFAAPVVIGEGALSRAGSVALVAVALASTPILASALLGTVVLFGRRLRLGDHVEIGARRGRIVAVGLLEVRLHDDEHGELRVPHLFALLHPLRVLGTAPRFTLTLVVPAGAPHADLRAAWTSVGARHGRDVSVELLSADADGVHYRLGAVCDSAEARSALGIAWLEVASGADVARARMAARS